MDDSHSIDGLVASHSVASAELAEIQKKISASARNAAIVLVDLIGSTRLKEGAQDHEWLGTIFDFLKLVNEETKAAGGTLVKRLGDGALMTFDSVAAVEAMFQRMAANLALQSYRYKIAAEFGPVHYLKFEPALRDDPYGNTVDRCARLLELAGAGVIVCGAGLFNASGDRTAYQLAGNFALKGFSNPQEVFVRLRREVADAERYLAPLLQALNEPKAHRPGYRYVARSFSAADFTELKDNRPRPFLVRELLNVPKLPLAYLQFRDHLRAAQNEVEWLDYYGMLVEWEATFDGYRLSRYDISIYMNPADHMDPGILLELPLFMHDAVRLLTKGQKINFRGIITGIDGLFIRVDYVELGACDSNKAGGSSR